MLKFEKKIEREGHKFTAKLVVLISEDDLKESGLRIAGETVTDDWGFVSSEIEFKERSLSKTFKLENENCQELKDSIKKWFDEKIKQVISEYEAHKKRLIFLDECEKALKSIFETSQFYEKPEIKLS